MIMLLLLLLPFYAYGSQSITDAKEAERLKYSRFFANLNLSVNPCDDFYSYVCSVPSNTFDNTFNRVVEEKAKVVAGLKNHQLPIPYPNISRVYKHLLNQCNNIDYYDYICYTKFRIDDLIDTVTEIEAPFTDALLTQLLIKLNPITLFYDVGLYSKNASFFITIERDSLDSLYYIPSGAMRSAVTNVNDHTKVCHEIADRFTREFNNTNDQYHESTVRELINITKYSVNWITYLSKILPKSIVKQYGSIEDIPIFIEDPKKLHHFSEMIRNLTTNELISAAIITRLSAINHLYSNRSSCTESVNYYFRDLFERVYADKYQFDLTSIYIRLYDIYHHIRNQFDTRIRKSALLNGAEKKTALRKLENMRLVVGAHPTILNISTFYEIYSEYNAEAILNAHTPFDSIREFIVWTHKRFFAKILPSTPSLHNWEMYFSYYDLVANQITIPLSNVRSPYVNFSRPIALDFGAIGYMIAHEIGHAFDTDGITFDEFGEAHPLSNPLNNATLDCYKNKFRNQRFVNFVPQTPDMILNEYIADTYGVRYALAALLEFQLEQLPSSDDYQMDVRKLFYFSFANTLCLFTNSSEYYSDTHGLPPLRVNLPLSDVQTFAETFNCTEGTPMNPISQRCEVFFGHKYGHTLQAIIQTD